MKIEHDQLIDDELRMSLIADLSHNIGLSNDDTLILLFSVLGDKQSRNISSVLKKIHFIKREIRLNDEKVRAWIDLISIRIKEFDLEGIIDFDSGKAIIKKDTQTGDYLTIFGLKLMPKVYAGFLNVLASNPYYVISTLVNIRNSLDDILKFLEVEEHD